MARGSIAKEGIVKRLAETFGSDFIGEYDKKVYIWGSENGEKVQIALSLTCPKTPIETDRNISVSTSGGYDFSGLSDSEARVAVTNAPPAEITQAETDNIAALMERLGL